MYSGRFYISAHRLVVKNDKLTAIFWNPVAPFSGLILYLRACGFWAFEQRNKQIILPRTDSTIDIKEDMAIKSVHTKSCWTVYLSSAATNVLRTINSNHQCT